MWIILFWQDLNRLEFVVLGEFDKVEGGGSLLPLNVLERSEVYIWELVE